MKNLSKLITCVAVSFLYVGNVMAGSVTLLLERVGAYSTTSDTGGSLMYYGGNVKKSGTLVGYYAVTHRVTTNGTSPLNTSAVTVTLFFGSSASTAPENITLQGAHNYSLGNFRGSVSAASNRYSWIQNADAVYSYPTGASNPNLTITWSGANQLTLP